MDDQKPDFENDDINYLMEEEMRATLKDRARKRNEERWARKFLIVIAVLAVFTAIAIPVGCVHLLKGSKTVETTSK